MSEPSRSRLPPPGAADTIYSVASVRELDRLTIRDGVIAGYALMTRAAQAALDATLERFPGIARIQLLCGGGNNAGDGFAYARLAAERGINVDVISITNPESLSGDARTAFADFSTAGLSAAAWAGKLDPGADLLVDALLGSGLDRPVAGLFRNAVDAINEHSAPVLALDIPTGLHGDEGTVMGAAVVADLTVTFVGLKTGLYLGDGPDHCGAIVFDGLGIPDRIREQVPGTFYRLPEDGLAAVLPPRKATAHKGMFGHVVIVGGGPGMPGALRLAGEAALRAGAGLVTLATHPDHVHAVTTNRPELMALAAATPADLDGLLERADVVAIGPGLGQSDWSRSMFGAAIDAGKPLVIDADALNLLALQPRPVADAVLTPHPGEASRLLQSTTADVQRNRAAALAKLADRYGATVVLKGRGTLVSSVYGPPWICSRGNPGMASPGMGDALTGIIAGLRGQHLLPEEAAVAGVDIHARAGDVAAANGQRGLVARDLIDHIRSCVNP